MPNEILHAISKADESSKRVSFSPIPSEENGESSVKVEASGVELGDPEKGCPPRRKDCEVKPEHRKAAHEMCPGSAEKCEGESRV